jgi:hypothetical protein
MEEPRWLTRHFVDLIHHELLSEHGGSPGVRAGGDELIESATITTHRADQTATS